MRRYAVISFPGATQIEEELGTSHMGLDGEKASM
jgi:hypothetical protein